MWSRLDSTVDVESRWDNAPFIVRLSCLTPKIVVVRFGHEVDDSFDESLLNSHSVLSDSSNILRYSSTRTTFDRLALSKNLLTVTFFWRCGELCSKFIELDRRDENWKLKLIDRWNFSINFKQCMERAEFLCHRVEFVRYLRRRIVELPSTSSRKLFFNTVLLLTAHVASMKRSWRNFYISVLVRFDRVTCKLEESRGVFKRYCLKRIGF